MTNARITFRRYTRKQELIGRLNGTYATNKVAHNALRMQEDLSHLLRGENKFSQTWQTT